MWHSQVSKEELLRECVEIPLRHLLPGFLHTSGTGGPRNEALTIRNGSGLRKALGSGYHRRPGLVVRHGARDVNARVDVCERIRCRGSEMDYERYLGLDTSRDGSR